MANAEAKKQLQGTIFLGLFFIFIASGIIAKRVYGHPDAVIFFHLPGAVCLVLALKRLSYRVQSEYRKALERF